MTGTRGRRGPSTTTTTPPPATTTTPPPATTTTPPPATTGPRRLDRLTDEQLVGLLTTAGGQAKLADLAADRAAGAPTNDDGTWHFLRYGAWLAARNP